MYKISVSKTKTFESCKKKFEFNYILKLKPKSFTFFDLGKLLHDVLENFHLALIDSPLMNQSKIMGRCFKSAKAKYGAGLSEEDMKLSYEIIDEYLQLLSKEETPAEILSVEKQFNLDIDGVVTLIGMIDRVQKDPDGMLHVIDYKSSKNMTYYEDDFLQMQFYAYVMMMEDTTLNKIRCSYQFLRHKFCCITKEFSREEIMKMHDVFINYAQSMQDEKEFPATVNFLCRYCGFSDICPDYRALNAGLRKEGKVGW